MMRVVLDTNVSVSALISSKDTPPSKIFSLLKNKKILSITSVEMLTEIEEVMNREKLVKLHRLNPLQIRDLVANWAKVSEVTIVKTRVSVVKEDPDDDQVIACALDGQADYIVSGDQQPTQGGQF